MAGTGPDLAAQAQLVVERLMADPTAGPTRDELAAASQAELPESGLSIGQMVAASGVSEHTLRYYERERLLSVGRGEGGQRRYDGSAVQRVFLISRMRISGMPIATLRQLTRLLDEHGPDHPDVVSLLQEHRDQLRRHIAELQLALAVTEYKLEVGRLAPDPRS